MKTAIFHDAPPAYWDIFEDGEWIGCIWEQQVEDPASFDPETYPDLEILMATNDDIEDEPS